VDSLAAIWGWGQALRSESGSRRWDGQGLDNLLGLLFAPYGLIG